MIAESPKLLEAKLEKVSSVLNALPFAGVAFSGGVDSALLLKLAFDAMGDRCVALLAVSASLPQRELLAARECANAVGVKLVEITTGETGNGDYQANAPNRCFHCKDVVYQELKEAVLKWQPQAVLLDGMNADDTLDVRPGRAAAIRQGVKSPLFEAGLNKAEVRHLARTLGLSVWDKPAAACLSSRVAYGIPVTDEILKRIEEAEDVLLHLGLSTCRVRHHGVLARIEVSKEDTDVVMSQASLLVDRLKALGWSYVTLDLEGLRQGSMNDVLGVKKR